MEAADAKARIGEHRNANSRRRRRCRFIGGRAFVFISVGCIVYFECFDTVERHHLFSLHTVARLSISLILLRGCIAISAIMAAADSLIDLQDTYNEKEDDIDSLPSTSTSTSDIYSDADSDAQAEWDRSLDQLQLLLTMMIVPWMGKYFGRKFAYWSMFCLFRNRIGLARHGSIRTKVRRIKHLLTIAARLGTIHGMDARRRSPMDQQKGIQGSWHSRDGRHVIERRKRLGYKPLAGRTLRDSKCEERNRSWREKPEDLGYTLHSRGVSCT